MFARTFILLLLVGSLTSLSTNLSHAQDAAPEKIKALIVDGQNNHDAWPKTTQMMKDYLTETGRFDVDVYRTRFLWNDKRFGDEFKLDDGKDYRSVKKAQTDDEFAPVFADYDVVISNFGYKAADWPESTQESFVEYMKNGGGLVVVHAADNSFPKWKEFNRMIGLGGWGGRDEKDGPYVYYDNEGELIRDSSPGKGGGHGPRRPFAVVVRDTDHPVMKGMPQEFMHSKDELYQTLRGPAEGMKVLATAFAPKNRKGTGRHEPMVMSIDYEKGRVFHMTLGHDDYSFEGVAMITLLQRGSEWAATGEVTIPIPDDFPTADKVSAREYKTDMKNEKEMEQKTERKKEKQMKKKKEKAMAQ